MLIGGMACIPETGALFDPRGECNKGFILSSESGGGGHILMRKKLPVLALMVVVWGMMGIIGPVSGISTEEELFPLFEGFSDQCVGTIAIDRTGARYTIVANVCEQNGTLYYEIMAHNPSGDPPTITWGMIPAKGDGLLRCNHAFDSITSAWIKAYGLNETTYSVRPLKLV